MRGENSGVCVCGGGGRGQGKAKKRRRRERMGKYLKKRTVYND